MKRITKALTWLLCAVILTGAVACTGEKSASGKIYPDTETLQQKQLLTDGKDREKLGSSPGCAADKVVVENNFLSSKDIATFTEKYANAKTEKEKEQLWADLKKLDIEQQAQALSTGISIADQKQVLADLKTLAASPDCTAKCQELVTYSISELEPVTNNTQLHEDNLKKGVLAAVIYALTVEKPISSGSGLSSLTKEQQQLIRNAETITTAKGIQNPFPRDLNEKIVWNQVRANPASAGEPLKGMNKDPRFPTSAGFQKMEAKQKLSDGSTNIIHIVVRLMI